jgi:uncharacterized YigZ family protein
MSSEITDKYLTIGARSHSAEIKVQGSRFIARAYHVATREAAEVTYNDIKKKFYDASHNCYAYRIDQTDFRFSDDGEPSGTAGKPIYQVLTGNNLYYSIIIVTRYFGGTKLGTGGLIRAYTDAAKSVLSGAKIIEKIRFREFQLIMKYDTLRDVQDLISRYHGNIINSDYGEKITLHCQIPLTRYSAFQEAIIHKIEIKDA